MLQIGNIGRLYDLPTEALRISKHLHSHGWADAVEARRAIHTKSCRAADVLLIFKGGYVGITERERECWIGLVKRLIQKWHM